MSKRPSIAVQRYFYADVNFSAFLTELVVCLPGGLFEPNTRMDGVVSATATEEEEAAALGLAAVGTQTLVLDSSRPGDIPIAPRPLLTPTPPFDPVGTDERHGDIPVKPHVLALVKKDREEKCPQRTQVWYEKRRNHLTASQIASAVGDNPYENRGTAIRKKVGLEPGFTGNAATEHGNKYEDVAIEKYEKRTGEKVLAFGLLESIKTSHRGEDVDTSFLAGSPDGITASLRLIEVKCPYRRRPNGIIPAHYVHQVQTLMHILQIPVCDFIEYVPGGTWQEEIFTVVTITRCDVFWETNFPVLQRFWNEVLSLRGEIEMHGINYVDEKTKPEPKKKRARRSPTGLTGCVIETQDDGDGNNNNTSTGGEEEAGSGSKEDGEEAEQQSWPFASEFIAAVQSKVLEISPV